MDKFPFLAGALALTWDVCWHNAVARMNAVFTALVPALDMARFTWPQLQPYLPHNVYGAGFVALAVMNILAHIALPTTPPAAPKPPP